MMSICRRASRGDERKLDTFGLQRPCGHVLAAKRLQYRPVSSPSEDRRLPSVHGRGSTVERRRLCAWSRHQPARSPKCERSYWQLPCFWPSPALLAWKPTGPALRIGRQPLSELTRRHPRPPPQLAPTHALGSQGRKVPSRPARPGRRSGRPGRPLPSQLSIVIAGRDLDAGGIDVLVVRATLRICPAAELRWIPRAGGRPRT